MAEDIRPERAAPFWSLFLRGAQRLAAALCLVAVYFAAASGFDLTWVAVTAFAALVLATAPQYWAEANAEPARIPWPPWVVLRAAFLPGWLLMLATTLLKGLGGSPRVTIWIWCAGTVWVLLGAWRASPSETRPSDKSTVRSVWIWAVVVLVVAAVLRGWSVGTVPREVHSDEGFTTFMAQAFYDDPARDWFGASVVMNLCYAIAGSGTLLFGINLPAARASDVLLGAASVMLLFEALRRVSTLRVAVIGALLLAANHTHIAYSRNAGAYIQPAFTVTLILATAAHLWSRPTYFNAALLGVVGGVGMQMGPASILSVPFLGATLLTVLLLQPVRRRALLVPLSIASITCATVAAPFALGTWQHRSQLLWRSGEVNIFSPLVMKHLKADIYQTDSTLQVAAMQAWNGLTGFHRGRNTQPQYATDRPLADQYTAALMIPGVIFAALRLRQFVAASALIFTAGNLLLGLGMHFGPGFQRTVGGLPTGMILAAIGLAQCCETLCAGQQWVIRWARNLLSAAAVTICCIENVYIYFVENRTTFIYADQNTEPGWVAREYVRDYHVHLVDWFPSGAEGLHLITADIPVSYNGFGDSLAYVKNVEITGPNLFIVFGDDPAARDALLDRFPDARVEVYRHHPQHGPMLFLVFVTRPLTASEPLGTRP